MVLQRGRACEGAEIRVHGERFGGAAVRFNGAAPVRARKCPAARPCLSQSAGLQRGRACEGAEISQPPAAEYPADRFNGAAPVRARKSGRDAPEPCRSTRFNGAAPVRARKSATGAREVTEPDCGFNGAAPVRARKCSS